MVQQHDELLLFLTVILIPARLTPTESKLSQVLGLQAHPPLPSHILPIKASAETA